MQKQATSKTQSVLFFLFFAEFFVCLFCFLCSILILLVSGNIYRSICWTWTTTKILFPVFLSYQRFASVTLSSSSSFVIDPPPFLPLPLLPASSNDLIQNASLLSSMGWSSTLPLSFSPPWDSLRAKQKRKEEIKLWNPCADCVRKNPT